MAAVVRDLRVEGRRIGLVPTRGALHEGHLSLMNRARELCDSVVVSILADPGDERPTADLARDAELAFTRGVDFIFAPAVESMFAEGFSTLVTVEGLSDKLEGANLPSRYRRATTVVNKLVNIVQPSSFLGARMRNTPSL